MEYFPVEVIGNILSRLEGVRDLIIASATCRKWQEARKNHTHMLEFQCGDNLGFSFDETDRRTEIIITRIITQTSRFERLRLHVGGKFSTDSVISWLTYVKDTLRELHYNVDTFSKINILEKCNLQKLEVLSLGKGSITLGESSNYKIFPYLRRLSLYSFEMSILDLRLLLTACPKIEFLSLYGVNIVDVGIESFHLSNNSLKDIHLKVIHNLGKFILEGDNIEKMHFQSLSFKSFQLVGKGTLKYLKIEDIKGFNFDISENVENLEVVDVAYCYYYFAWEKFLSMISKSQKLRRLSICQFHLPNIDVDIEAMVARFPLLTHLSCNYIDASAFDRRYLERFNRLCKDLYSFYRNDDDLKVAVINKIIDEAGQGGGSSSSRQWQNLVVLKLGWSSISHEFSSWIATVLEKCPNLRKLIICGTVSDIINADDSRSLANFTTSIVRLMRKYMDIEVEFEWA